jgi:hypothetical protein
MIFSANSAPAVMVFAPPGSHRLSKLPYRVFQNAMPDEGHPAVTGSIHTSYAIRRRCPSSEFRTCRGRALPMT